MPTNLTIVLCNYSTVVLTVIRVTNVKSQSRLGVDHTAVSVTRNPMYMYLFAIRYLPGEIRQFAKKYEKVMKVGVLEIVVKIVLIQSHEIENIGLKIVKGDKWSIV